MNVRNVFHKAIDGMARFGHTRTGGFMIETITLAHKFIVPDAGQMTTGKPYDDLKAMMHLPFERIALLRQIDFAGKKLDQVIVAAEAALVVGHEHVGSIDYFVAECTRHPTEPDVWLPTAPVGVQLQHIGGGIQLLNLEGTAEDEKLIYGSAWDGPESTHGLNGLSELLVMLSLANVTTRRIEGPKSLNMKRQKKGRPPLYDYHVLLIDGHEVYAREGGSESADNGVRSHFRRGHIRRLDDTRRVWVRASYVRGSVPGFVDKDYRVTQ